MKKLPGVGNYTANALLALVYNQPRIPFDGNVQRVFYRLFKVKLDKNEKKIKKIINKYFFTNRNSDLAEALMEFGAIICKPANPLCDECNLRKNCYLLTIQIENIFLLLYLLSFFYCLLNSKIHLQQASSYHK